MRCGVCHATLTIRGHRTKEYRDDSGHVYKTRRSPIYNPCPRINDAAFHPAVANREGPWAQGGLNFPRNGLKGRMLQDRIAHAEAMSSRYLGNYNEEIAAGRTRGAEKMLAKSQHWLDVANKLRGNT